MQDSSASWEGRLVAVQRPRCRTGSGATSSTSWIRRWLFPTYDAELLQVVSTLPPDFSGTSSRDCRLRVGQIRVRLQSRAQHHRHLLGRSEERAAHRGGLGADQGRTPRCFGLDPSGSLFYACNQDSDTVVPLRVDDATGKLAPIGQVVKTGSPVTIVFS